jgi:hypothetical protein
MKTIRNPEKRLFLLSFKDYYFHKWSQQKRHMQQVHGNQLNRHEHRGQYISYPVLQLLKSIQQEKEYIHFY